MRSYLDLVGAAPAATKDHELFVCLQIDAKRAWRQIKRVGGKVSGAGGLWAADWNTAHVKKGRHVVTATVRDRGGRTFAANRALRVCR